MRPISYLRVLVKKVPIRPEPWSDDCIGYLCEGDFVRAFTEGEWVEVDLRGAVRAPPPARPDRGFVRTRNRDKLLLAVGDGEAAVERQAALRDNGTSWVATNSRGHRVVELPFEEKEKPVARVSLIATPCTLRDASPYFLGLEASSFAELWAVVPWTSKPALAATCVAAARAARGVPWRRLCKALCDERRLMCLDLALGLPNDDREWKEVFARLWRPRQDDFSIKAFVRFRPPTSGAISSSVFLPLHQRLQLRRLGLRAGAVEKPTMTVTTRQRARVVSTEPHRVLVAVPSKGLSYFDYDRVLQGATQRQTYEEAARPLVRALCDGYDGCLLAYGQTGSGKSHTMFGPNGALRDAVNTSLDLSRDAGLVPRCVRDVVETARGSARVTLTYLELYREQLTDLFTGEPVALYRVGEGLAADEHRRRRGSDADVALSGATSWTVEDLGETWDMLFRAEERKQRAATALNDRSSRSHCVFTIRVNASVLSLVDLGGSEQIKKSVVDTVHDKEKRVKEAIDINKALAALGRVVDALVSRRYHVPYYESRLTTLLRPAFGGRSKTVVLVHASSDDADGDETLAALRFGQRAARVRNLSKAPTADMPTVIKTLQDDIAKATRTVADLEAKGAHRQALAEINDPTLRGVGARLTARRHDDDCAGDASKEVRLSKTGNRAGVYTHVDDDAGRWLIETRRLDALQARYNDILGLTS